MTQSAQDDHFEGVGESASDDEFDISGGAPYVPAIASPLGPEDFEYYWCDELVTMYHLVKDTAHDNGWQLFEGLDFCAFCKFAYTMSSKAKPTC